MHESHCSSSVLSGGSIKSSELWLSFLLLCSGVLPFGLRSCSKHGVGLSTLHAKGSTVNMDCEVACTESTSNCPFYLAVVVCCSCWFHLAHLPHLSTPHCNSAFTDVEDIKFVINYDYPNSSEDYVHRIGRTARSTNKGTAYTFFTPGNVKQARELIKVLEEANQAINPKLLQLVDNGRGGGRGGRSRYRPAGSNPNTMYRDDRDRSRSRSFRDLDGDRRDRGDGGSRFGGQRDSRDATGTLSKPGFRSAQTGSFGSAMFGQQSIQYPNFTQSGIYGTTNPSVYGVASQTAFGKAGAFPTASPGGAFGASGFGTAAAQAVAYASGNFTATASASGGRAPQAAAQFRQNGLAQQPQPLLSQTYQPGTSLLSFMSQGNYQYTPPPPPPPPTQATTRK